ncbi:sensor histidine kinase [Metabacillus malikii]|uniref:histidine kinase n=1 Tax=Metabacillus malikii TaxID=1504265 RepID=A0ABT9ZF14_9BACI|nr:sensor histidine kinase [Metabacillus malikii]MDQ0230861.1 OmpR family two-component system bacitracin resistance sensor histidine kinase BceS [Metabacillus malikii]
MIANYIIERRSWIFLFLTQQLIILIIGYLDSSIPFTSMLYITFLTSVIFVLFFTFRYIKETKFYSKLHEWDNSLDLKEITLANSPFEKIVIEQFESQTEQLKRIATKNQLELNQEKDELMAWIHEVKTPLTAMHLMIERLEEGPLKSQIVYEWLRIHLLLDQQLHQKRASFIENDMYLETVNVKKVIYQEIKTLQSWCIQKGIGFEVNLERESALTDEKWLAFIVRQLLTNAIKYSHNSDINISSYEIDGRTVLAFTDYGRGISPQDIPRIFERGFTSTTFTDNASTGMGLYLTKKIATALMIKIEVTSNINLGTTFTLTFPKRNDFVDIMSM